MGLIDFVRNAGAYLFGSKAGSPVSEAEAATAPITVDTLRQQLDTLDIAVDGLELSLIDGVATIRGTVATQRDREVAILGIGNTPGVATVDDQLTVRGAEAAATFYTVKKGDTLSAIAKAQLGSANAYVKIFEANRPMLKDPDRIYPGQVLRIPPPPAAG